MTGTEVYACKDASDASCSKCGAFRDTLSASWGIVSCDNDVIATIIKFEAPENFLQMAEVEINGHLQGISFKFHTKTSIGLETSE